MKNLHRIPTSFKLGGNTWRVKRAKLRDAYGDCNPTTYVIRIATHVNGVATTEKIQFQAYLHEWAHAILFTMGRGAQETLVAGLEQMLYQSITTAKYPKDETNMV